MCVCVCVFLEGCLFREDKAGLCVVSRTDTLILSFASSVVLTLRSPCNLVFFMQIATVQDYRVVYYVIQSPILRYLGNTDNSLGLL